MNPGITGKAILKADKHKTVFLDILADNVDKFHMRLFAYCVMDNHHLVLENASGRMSNFFRNLNIQFVFYFYKKKEGPK
jgi:hypothetical protein